MNSRLYELTKYSVKLETAYFFSGMKCCRQIVVSYQIDDTVQQYTILV